MSQQSRQDYIEALRKSLRPVGNFNSSTTILPATVIFSVALATGEKEIGITLIGEADEAHMKEVVVATRKIQADARKFSKTNMLVTKRKPKFGDAGYVPYARY